MAPKQDMATLYKITKSLADVFKNSYVPIKDSDGNVTTDIIKCDLSRKNVNNGYYLLSGQNERLANS